MNTWVIAANMVPDTDRWVLACLADSDIGMAIMRHLGGGSGAWDDGSGDSCQAHLVTHWMDLPELPKYRRKLND